MSHSFSNYVSSSTRSILLVARPGVGKTVLMSQMPKAYILECDNNISGPVDFVKSQLAIGKKLRTDAVFDIPHISPDGTLLQRSKRYTRFAELAGAAAGNAEFETVCVDSLTTFTDYVADEVRRQQKRKIEGEAGATQDDPLQLQDWGVFYGVTKQFIIKMKACGKRVVFSSHIDTRLDESEQTKNWMEYIAIPGALREQISGLFDEVWYLDTYSKTTPQGVQYVRRIRTVPTDFRQAGLGLKTGLGLGYTFDLNFDELLPKL